MFYFTSKDCKQSRYRVIHCLHALLKHSYTSVFKCCTKTNTFSEFLIEILKQELSFNALLLLKYLVVK